MVANGLFVGLTLLYFTPMLYHLPKAVLAVIILLAVTSLITPKESRHTWLASRSDGITMTVTFVITLLAAPHLDKGILIGAGLAIVLYLFRTMKPRVAVLGRFGDGPPHRLVPRELSDDVHHPQGHAAALRIPRRRPAASTPLSSTRPEALTGCLASVPACLRTPDRARCARPSGCRLRYSATHRP